MHVAIHEAIVLESVPMVPFLVDALHYGTGEGMCDAPPDENPALQTFTWVDRKQDAPQVSLAPTLLMDRKSGRLQGVANSAGQLLPGTQLGFVCSLYHHSSSCGGGEGQACPEAVSYMA